MMRVGFYKDDLEEPDFWYDEDAIDAVNDLARDFAEGNHEIVEASDMKFSVYVEDKDGVIHQVHMYTEFDPRFEVVE